jgi:hypothetical protein
VTRLHASNSRGKMPLSNEELIILAKVIENAFDVCLSMTLLMPSGPDAFFTFRAFSKFSISLGDVLMLYNTMVVGGISS